MYLITPLLSSNQLTNDGLNCLIRDIDERIGDMATVQFTNQIYGFKKPVDMDYYDDLCDYREILIDKLLGCNCWDDMYLVVVFSRIKTLLQKQC